jgi:hypothetical protein
MTQTRAHRNPDPRPALRFEGEENYVVAARPLPGLGDGADPDLQPDERPDDAKGGRRKGKGEKGEKGGKRDKAGKEHRRRKADKKRAKDETQPPSHGRNDRTLTISMPEEFRRALERAAGEHGLTPEGLAAFVLVEWLDR